MSLAIKSGIIIGLLGASASLSAIAEGELDHDAFDNDDLECVLEPNTEVEISAAVAGVLSQVSVQRGDVVKRGQSLAKLISGPEQAAVELARARVEFGKRKAVRNADLYKKELISIHEKDEMDTEVLIARLQLKQAQEQLKLRSVTSPINGVVVERDRDPGEYVEEESLLTIVSLDPLSVEVVAPAERFGTIKKGMRGEVTTVGPMSGTYEAEVTLIDQIIDAASGTIRVRLALANPDNAIPAGLKCYVKFLAETKEVAKSLTE